ncbi:DUF4133 domain-containing protein [Echinicola sp. 20G]|uniref:DUF4133 domain-containing protein n=1 Tax=Echinicola sp. 20G TaxID=2781961 RepID=UPI00190FCCF0|nr:DUF4133 domain-containing protein [Echinicola sp. 20G]
MEYRINKGINRPIEFKGLSGQYLAYMAVGLVVLLLGVSIAYMVGVPAWLIILMTGLIGAILSISVFKMNAQYGRHGLMKKWAYKKVPQGIRCRSRKVFQELRKR